MKTSKLFFMVVLVVLAGMIEVNAQGFTTNQTTFYFSNARSGGSYNSNYGFNSGSNSTDSNNNSNVNVGHYAGSSNTSGYENTFLGFWSGLNNTSGKFNVFLGSQSGLTNTEGEQNTYVGTFAGKLNTLGSDNAMFGYQTGLGTTTGNRNSFFGRSAGYGNSIGSDNTYGGYASGYFSRGTGNTYLGANSGWSAKGSNNVYIGHETGYGLYVANNESLGLGSGNVFIGNRVGFGGAGVSFTNNSDQLLIDNDDVTDPLVQGNFLSEILLLNVNANDDSRVEIKSKVNHTSGLRFTNLKSTSPITTNTTVDRSKLLSVTDQGEVVLTNNTGNFWALSGNSGTSPSYLSGWSTFPADIATLAASNFIGTTTGQDLVFRRHNRFSGMIGDTNTSLGNGATGTTASGVAITGMQNASFGAGSGTAISSGVNNTSMGFQAMSRVNGNGNTALGCRAGSNNNGATANGNIYIGNGSGSPTVAAENNQMYIDNFATDTPIIKGGLDPSTRSLIFNVVGPNATGGNSKVTINSIGTSPASGVSGLRFSDMNNTAPAANNTTKKVLSVNNNASGGDVVLVNDRSFYDEDGTINTTDGDDYVGLRIVTMEDNNLFFNTADSAAGYGKVYIGDSAVFPSTTGNYRLYVEGGILAEKAKVSLRSSTANWADYVFEDDYKLMPLSEIEAFVNKNKHLPGIDSAEVLVQNGLDLGEMQAKQMGKIEELTLYAIEQEKKIEKQGKEIEELKTLVKLLIDKNK